MGQSVPSSPHSNMLPALLVLLAAPGLHGLCLVNKCSSYWSGAKSSLLSNSSCAVIFDENCCKSSDTYHVVKKGEEGKLCSTTSSFNPLSSCKAPGLKDDIESLLVMPGCKLEVWDKSDGLEDAKKEESKGFNQGDYKDQVDRYDRNKLVFTARGDAHWVEEINDDFDDMDEDIESYRCTC